MSNPAHHPHDHLFRSTFSQPEVMREYVQHFLPRELSTQIIVYLFYTVKPKEDLMKAVKQVDQAELIEDMSLYEFIFFKSSFKIFRKGLMRGLDLDTLIELTEIPLEVANKWRDRLASNPDLTFSDLYEDPTEG